MNSGTVFLEQVEILLLLEEIQFKYDMEGKVSYTLCRNVEEIHTALKKFIV
jgi:hypothetical protein